MPNNASSGIAYRILFNQSDHIKANRKYIKQFVSIFVVFFCLLPILEKFKITGIATKCVVAKINVRFIKI